jgi:carboxyl-terminal processing protease
MTARTVRQILVILAFSAVSLFVGYKLHDVNSLGTASAKVQTDRSVNNASVSFNQFWDVWDLIKQDYYDQSQISDKELVYGAIKGMVAAIGDPYTVFLTPTEQKITSDDLNGNFDGVGIQLGFKDKALAVIAPLPGTPADRAGIQPGDIIAAIKDEQKSIDKSTDGMSLEEAVGIIRGKAGTKVTIAIVRDGEAKAQIIDLTREKINVPSVTLEFVGDKKQIAHLKILKFGGETRDEWAKAVKTISTTPGVTGIALDVRNNPGGYLQAAVDIASEFLNQGTEVVHEESSGKVIERLNTTRQGAFVNTPVAILINGGSASASEILSGALRDQKNIQLIGDKSFGKGTVQEPKELANGTGIHITIAKWLTPKGVWVHKKGLEPDIAVANKLDTKDDEQLQEAIKQLLKK